VDCGLLAFDNLLNPAFSVMRQQIFGADREKLLEEYRNGFFGKLDPENTVNALEYVWKDQDHVTSRYLKNVNVNLSDIFSNADVYICNDKVEISTNIGDIRKLKVLRDF
jgi:hypothetical protein